MDASSPAGDGPRNRREKLAMKEAGWHRPKGTYASAKDIAAFERQTNGGVLQIGYDKWLHGRTAPEDPARAQQFLDAITQATSRYEDPAAAAADGYVFDQATIDRKRSMVHVKNPAYIHDGIQGDPTRPEFLMYEKRPDGSLHLVGAVLTADAATAPDIGMGMWHNHFDPNRDSVMMHIQFTGDARTAFVESPSGGGHGSHGSAGMNGMNMPG